MVQEISSPSTTCRILRHCLPTDFTDLCRRHVPLPFWNFKLDASVFLYLDSPKNAMASVSTGFIILRILVILLLSGFVTWILYRITPRYLPPANRKITGTLATILLGGVLFIIIRGGVSESTSNIGQVYFCNDEFLNHSAVNPAFSLIASAGKTKTTQNNSTTSMRHTVRNCSIIFILPEEKTQ